MAQVKKASIQNAIVEAAFSLFSEKGYQATSMPEIAARAGITAGNIYRYYKSKFELFYDVLKPWLHDQLDLLEREVAEIESDRERFRRILAFLWIELPRAGNNFEINLMEALATKKPDDTYSRQLLNESEQRISDLLADCLLGSAKRWVSHADLTHLLFMCHDGFVLNARLAEEGARIDRIIDQFAELAFAES